MPDRRTSETEAAPLGPLQQKLPVPDLSVHPVGRNATRRPGQQQLRLLSHLGLTPETRLLEIGCGVGRLVYELADFLSGGRYEGFDIAPRAIEWLQKHYAPLLPAFRFTLVAAGNRRYNPNEKEVAARVSFPYPARSFDMLCAFSVFTHMLPADIEHYLVEVERVLAPRGRGVLTFFGMRPEDGDCSLGTGETFVPLPGYAHSWTTSLEVPERAIAFDDSWIRSAISAAKLELVDTLRGTWRANLPPAKDKGAKRPSFHKDVYVVQPRA